MAIVNPTGGRTSGLLKQILAEREQFRSSSIPAASPTSPIRQTVQGPELQPESPGSNRVVSVKPNLGAGGEAPLPPAGSPQTGGGGAPSVTPGGVVGPQADRPEVALPGPATAPIAAPRAPSPTATAPGRPAASRPQPLGQVLGISTQAPVRSRITNRRIVGLPTNISLG